VKGRSNNLEGASPLSHLKHPSGSGVFGRPDNHDRVAAKFDNIPAVPRNHVDQHGEILVRVRLELLRVQPGAESRESRDVREQ